MNIRERIKMVYKEALNAATNEVNTRSNNNRHCQWIFDEWRIPFLLQGGVGYPSAKETIVGLEPFAELSACFEPGFDL